MHVCLILKPLTQYSNSLETLRKEFAFELGRDDSDLHGYPQIMVGISKLQGNLCCNPDSNDQANINICCDRRRSRPERASTQLLPPPPPHLRHHQLQ